MGQQYLIDSNAVIDYLGGKFSARGMEFMKNVVNEIPKISVITKIEVLGYNASRDSYQVLTDFVDASILLELSDDVVLRTISLRKTNKIKTPDAIIASTALVFDLTLITSNTFDFKNIKGLKISNPKEL